MSVIMKIDEAFNICGSVLICGYLEDDIKPNDYIETTGAFYQSVCVKVKKIEVLATEPKYVALLLEQAWSLRKYGRYQKGTIVSSIENKKRMRRPNV